MSHFAQLLIACAMHTAGPGSTPGWCCSPHPGVRLHTPVAVAAATLAAAALFSPVRRPRYDTDRTVAAFAARLDDAVDLNLVRDDLAGTDTTRSPSPTC